MNFADVVSAVIGITKRPDKQQETERAVNAALSFFCLKEKFPLDLVEGSLSINATFYGDTVSIASLTRFRSFKYLKIRGAKGYLTKLEPEQIFTPGGITQTNVYYIAGQNLTYILRTLTDTLDYGYLQYPSVLTGTNTHWLLDMQPHCVIDKAAAIIFKSIGDDASFRIHEVLATDAYNVLVRDLC